MIRTLKAKPSQTQVAKAMGTGRMAPAISIRAIFLQGDEGPNATHIEATIVFPDDLQALVRSSGGNLRVVATPQDAFVITPDGALHRACRKCRCQDCGRQCRRRSDSLVPRSTIRTPAARDLQQPQR